MKSIRTQATLLTVLAVIVTLTTTALLGALAIRHIGLENSRQTLMLLGEAGEKNLNSYFDSVEQSVEMVYAYTQTDLNTIQLSELGKHLERVKEIFQQVAYKTNGVLTYYYRINPSISQTEKGFWFVNLDGRGFVEHTVTDITLYDLEDTTRLVWFTVPRATGKAIWLPPYITDNLDRRVISYNVPLYYQKTFLGVLGIEIDYKVMADQVNNITLYENGYAFLNDEEGRLIYHPRMNLEDMLDQPPVPAGLLGKDNLIHYAYQGVKKVGVWLPLHNGMRLNICVPVSEIHSLWHSWIRQITFVSVFLLLIFITITLYFAEQITKPLEDLTQVAERVSHGDFECSLDYDREDEVGILAKAINRLIPQLKSEIHGLNNLAYVDSLTSLRNKAAFDIYSNNLQLRMEGEGEPPRFAVGIFDCNNLKTVNDQNGHDKGDIYLKESAAVIVQAFSHSPVFRIGGDEFATVLQNEDYEQREELLSLFDRLCKEKSQLAQVPWHKVTIARGIAVYDPREDRNVSDVVRQADRNMYENKWACKGKRPPA